MRNLWFYLNYESDGEKVEQPFKSEAKAIAWCKHIGRLDLIKEIRSLREWN